MYCTSNWYGHTCNVYCADHHLDAGFICDPSGSPVCNNGKGIQLRRLFEY